MNPVRSTRHLPSGWPLALPALIGVLVLIIAPTLSLLPIAFTDWQLGLGRTHWVGAHNFIALADDPYFLAALRNTLLYTAVVAPCSLAGGLVAALLIDGTRALRHVYRATLFLPTIATMAAMAVAWEALLHPTLGLVNSLLHLLGIGGPFWLQDEQTVLPTLMGIGVWQNFGLAMVFFLAGLRTIPRELHDAAALDGVASAVDRFRYVVWPLLGPVSLFVLVLTAERAFAVFDTVQVLTNGGPGNSSEVLLHLLFVEGTRRLRAGYGAAMALTYLIMLGSLVLIQRRLFDAQVHYQ